MPATVCLDMIVKNEAHVLERCLASVRPLIQAWVIVDTGSTDGTQELVRRVLADLPGELHERPWKSFGHNRSEALALARGKADYTLIIDADEELELPLDFRLPELVAEQYLLLHRLKSAPDMSFRRGTLVKSSLPWRYEGVLHEYITCDEPFRSEPLLGPVVWNHPDGARNADPVAKYAGDARLLEAALVDEPNNARYVFYLAQSYRDSNQLEKALAAYERRVALGGWVEETFYAALQIGVLGERLGWDDGRIAAAYLRAYQLRPVRAEALCALATYYRFTQKWALAELFARAAVAISRPADILFVDESVYRWRALDELAIASFYVGKTSESFALNQRLLESPELPAHERPRIEKNMSFSANAPDTRR
ncbi:MAG TPA: glycosyltransferase [Polyangiaceae bacterium]